MIKLLSHIVKRLILPGAKENIRIFNDKSVWGNRHIANTHSTSIEPLYTEIIGASSKETLIFHFPGNGAIYVQKSKIPLLTKDTQATLNALNAAFFIGYQNLREHKDLILSDETFNYSLSIQTLTLPQTFNDLTNHYETLITKICTANPSIKRIIFTGHSLGGSLACTVSKKLYEKDTTIPRPLVITDRSFIHLDLVAANLIKYDYEVLNTLIKPAKKHTFFQDLNDDLTMLSLNALITIFYTLSILTYRAFEPAILLFAKLALITTGWDIHIDRKFVHYSQTINYDGTTGASHLTAHKNLHHQALPSIENHNILLRRKGTNKSHQSNKNRTLDTDRALFFRLYMLAFWLCTALLTWQICLINVLPIKYQIVAFIIYSAHIALNAYLTFRYATQLEEPPQPIPPSVTATYLSKSGIAHPTDLRNLLTPNTMAPINTNSKLT